MNRTFRHPGRYRPSLDVLEDRCVPAGIDFADGMMTITGTGAGDIVVISDDGAGTLFALCGTFDEVIAGTAESRTESGVSAVEVRTHGGRDTVFYQQRADRSSDLDLNVWMGHGEDSFFADINGAINAGQLLDIFVDGGREGDFITVDARGVAIRADPFGLTFGVLALDLHGGERYGRDTITIMYQGELDGVLRFEAHGERGDDVLRAEINVAAGSSGFLSGYLDGGQQGDDLVFHITQEDQTDHFHILNALARGGSGDDSWDITQNVRKRNL